MSRIHLSSSRIVLCLSLAAFSAGMAGVSCSSSDSDPAAGGASGKANSSKAGKGNTEAGGEDGESAGGEAPVEAGGSGNEGGATPVEGEPDAGAGPVETGGSSTGGSSTGGSGTAGSAPTDPNAAAIKHAKAVINALDTSLQCPACHQSDYAGSGFWPNITSNDGDCDSKISAPRQCGVGGWTDEQLKAAIVDGKDVDGSALCGQMARYKFTTSELNDIVTYLRSLPVKTKTIRNTCGM